MNSTVCGFPPQGTASGIIRGVGCQTFGPIGIPLMLKTPIGVPG